MWKLKGSKVPIYSWADPKTIEPDTLTQIKNLAKLDFAHHHVALMPDAHLGYGMPIGGILASRDYIIPNAVGVDIGCGIVAVKTSLSAKKFKQYRQDVGHEITRAVPTGFHKHKKPHKDKMFTGAPDLEVINREVKNARLQIGTLGGGNHFVDILKDEQNEVWIMVHSGSRHLGKSINDHYHKLAKEYTSENFGSYPSPDLSALPTTSKDGQDYIRAMKYAQQFAFSNRQHMLKAVKEAFLMYYPDAKFGEEINIHHNYAAREEHFGEAVWVHRKGAISAKSGELGIVPGSMATYSFITSGLGNPDSFHSAAHGAGRRLGRREAKRRYTKEDVLRDLDTHDVKIFAANTAGMIEEYSKSYKDVEEIMKLQNDLVEVKYRLLPMLVVIG